MEKPIKFKFILYKPDYINALRSFYSHQPGNLIFGSFLLFAVIAGVIGLVRNGIETTILLMVLFASIGLVYPYFISPLIIGRQIEKHESFGGEMDWSVAESGIVIKLGSSESNLDWDVFHDFIETSDSFLVIRSENNRAFQIVPKRAFDSSEQEAGFRGLMDVKFRTRQKPFFVRHWRLILFASFILVVNVYVMYILGNGK